MVHYKLHASVNPLEPNCLFQVASSAQLCMGPDKAFEYLQEKGRELKAKGYKVSLTKVTTETIDI